MDIAENTSKGQLRLRTELDPLADVRGKYGGRMLPSIAQEINRNQPDEFGQTRLSPEVLDGLALQRSEALEHKWEETLWLWIRSTATKAGAVHPNLGGNAIGLLFRMRTSLVQADLRDTILIGAHLRKADLSRANMANCHLENSDLSSASLCKSVCQNALLTDCDLSFTDLTGAQLHQASLTRANLTGAILQGADLSRADLTAAVFHNAVLKQAQLFLTLHGGRRLDRIALREYIACSPFFTNCDLQDVEYGEPLQDIRMHSGCFVGETRIRMPRGDTRKISEIQVGDSIVSLCKDATTEIIGQVIEIYEGAADVIVEINKELYTTPSEVLFTRSGWKKAAKLSIGDTLLTPDGWRNIDHISVVERQTKIYNLTVLPFHNFFADGYLVHNSPKLQINPESY